MFGLAVSASWSRSVTSAVAEFGLASVLYHCLHLLLHVPEIELIFLDASAHGLEGYALFCIISLNSIFSSLMHCQYFTQFFMRRIFLPSPFASLINFLFEQHIPVLRPVVQLHVYRWRRTGVTVTFVRCIIIVDV